MSLAEGWNINGNGNRYDEFTQWVGDALANLAGAGIGYSVEGMLWMQGENDAIALNRANSYQNMPILIPTTTNNYWVDTDGFVVNPIDGVHFDSSGHLALGETFANVFTS